MRTSQIKSKWRQGQPVLVAPLQLVDPAVFELTGLMGFDAIWMDLEHHTLSLETASQLMRAARIGCCDIVARPAKGEFMRMSRMLEAGAQAIMYPRCDNAAEAAEVVRWCRFAPLGERGFDGGNPDAPYASMAITEYIEQANRETTVIVQLESPAAVEQVDEIARVEGVDALMLGPADFSVLSGIPGQWHHPLVEQALQRISQAAAAAGKQWGAPGLTLDYARRLLEMGAGFVCGSADLILLKNGLEQVQREFGALGFTFQNQLDGPPPGDH